MLPAFANSLNILVGSRNHVLFPTDDCYPRKEIKTLRLNTQIRTIVSEDRDNFQGACRFLVLTAPVQVLGGPSKGLEVSTDSDQEISTS